MKNTPGYNTDGDAFTPALGEHLKRSFIRLCDAAQNGTENILIGRWHYRPEVTYLASCYYDACVARSVVPADIPFADYHLIHNDDSYMHEGDMFELVATIARARQCKVVFTNQKNRRMCDIFRTTSFIEIPQQCWYQHYNQYFKLLQEYLTQHSESIVIFSAGMACKALIADMFSQFPSTSFLDFGSAFDLLCQGYRTRLWKHKYADDYNYYKKLLPHDWPTPTQVLFRKLFETPFPQVLRSLRNRILM